jgi:hypothetical protein
MSVVEKWSYKSLSGEGKTENVLRRLVKDSSDVTFSKP